jgi:hypothetical protein
MLSLISAALLAAPALQPVPTEFRTGANVITASKARAHLERLTSDEFYGRGTGQRGYQLAAEWMADQFKSFGLEPIGEDGYFHMTPFTQFKPTEAALEVEGSEPINLARGLTLDGVSGDISIEGTLTVIPSSQQDLAGDSLAGQVVVLVGSFDRGQMQVIQRRQPAAIVWATDNAWGEAPVRFGHDQPERAGRGAPMAFIPQPHGLKIASRLRALDGMKATSLKVKLSAQIQPTNVEIPNVVAWLPGSDASVRHEFVGIGCHLDHLGISRGVVYPGADDDGSGTAAVLLAAEAFAKNPVKPKRSVLFMAFTGEEMGLLGAGHLAANPPGGLSLANMRGLVQLDMVGRNEESATERAEDNVNTIHLVGSQKGSMDYHNVILEVNKQVGFTFEYDQEDVYRRSDHYKFAERGVPVAFLFAGFTPDYHQPTDTIDKINFDKIVKSARLAYLTSMASANRAEPYRKNGTEPVGG